VESNDCQAYVIGGETTYDTGIEFVAIEDEARAEIARLVTKGGQAN